MCVDFIDLNDIYSKDPYPIPNIYCMINGSSSDKTLIFMDAYSGYNQIKMDPMEALTREFMSNHGNY